MPKEYAIADIGPTGTGHTLYLHKTWPTMDEAEMIRNELLYGFNEDNEWHSRLVIVPCNPIRTRRQQKKECAKD